MSVRLLKWHRMIESDIERIERALGLRLPFDYRHLLLHFPVRFSAGTTEQPLWDNADALISRNRELRAHRRSLGVAYQPIPCHYFLIGEDGAGWQFLIDLRENPSTVYIMEFERVDRIAPSMTADGKPQAIDDWLHSYLLELRNDGIDITSELAPSGRIGWRGILLLLVFCALMATSTVLIIAGIESLSGR